MNTVQPYHLLAWIHRGHNSNGAGVDPCEVKAKRKRRLKSKQARKARRINRKRRK